MNLSLKGNTKLGLLIALLIGLVLISTYFTVALGSTGFLVMFFILGAGLGIISLMHYQFGFYLAVSLGFLVAFISRIIGNETSVAFLVDIQINVTFVGLIIHKVVQKQFFFRNSNHPITYAYFLYTLFLLIEVFNPEMQSLEGWFFVLRKFFQFLMIYFVAVNMFRDLQSIRFFLIFWGVWSFIAGIYGCYQEWFGFFDFEMNWIFSVPGRAGLYALDNGDFRKFSLISGPAAYGIVMSASGLLFGVLALREKDLFNKILLLTVTAFCIFGMAYAGTRTGYFIFTVGAILYILMTITNLSTMITACVFVFGFAVIMWGPIYGNVIVNRIRSAFDPDDSSLSVRDMNRASIQPYIHSHPIGGGLASSGVQGLQYSPDHYLAGFPPDSGFVKTAIETGWVGFFLQCLLYCLILLSGVRVFYRTQNYTIKVYSLAAVVTLFGFVISQYGQVSIGQIPDCFLFYSLLAIIVRLNKISGHELSD